ncbi:MAG: response regulator transcription factor [Rhodocyclaceae bacterium]|nr:response regulator transcription factor [Rhodocyclaceae bacterium]
MHYSERHKAKILVVDDHPIVRQGISQLIDREPDLHACCEASNAEEALSACQSCRPDLAIVDLSLTGVSGLELVKQLRSRFPALAILVMSMHDETIYAERCLRAGANGYLMKQEATTTVLSAIRAALKGEFHLSERMRTLLLQQRITGLASESPIAGLTATEFEVFNQIGKGLGIAEIAKQLNRSASTIETHRANIKRKLGIAANAELVLYAYNRLNEASPGTPGG